MHVLQNELTGLYAAKDCEGQHDGRFTADRALAAEFESYGLAALFSQNFDDSWMVIDEDYDPLDDFNYVGSRHHY